MPSVNPTHFYFFMFLNLALVFVPDNSWSRVAMGSTAERQRISEKNLHESWWSLDEHRWSWNKRITCFIFIYIFKLNISMKKTTFNCFGVIFCDLITVQTKNSE